MVSATIPLSALQKNLHVDFIETVQYPGNAIAGGLAQATRTRIPKNFVYADLNLFLQGLVNIVGGGGALADEQPLSLIREIRLEGSSQSRPAMGDIRRMDAPAMFVWSLYNYGTYGRVVPLATPNAQVGTAFSFDIEIPFALVGAPDPRISLLNTRELDTLDLVIEWETAAGLSTVGGGGSITINQCSLTITGREYQDPISVAGRYKIQRISQIDQPIATTNPALRIDVKTGYQLRGFLLKQFTGAAFIHTTDETIISGSLEFQLNRIRKKFYTIFGQLLADNKLKYSIEILPFGYAFLDLMEEGNLDTLVDTSKYESVELVLGVTAGVNSRVKIYPIELLPVPGEQ